jgi:hypothetical protein
MRNAARRHHASRPTVWEVHSCGRLEGRFENKAQAQEYVRSHSKPGVKLTLRQIEIEEPVPAPTPTLPRAVAMQHAKKKSPAQLQREIDAVLTGASNGASHATKRGAEVEPGFGHYIVQGSYAGPQNILVGGSERWYDDEAEAIKAAKDMLRSPYFEGDKTRVITLDGEMVWNSHPERTGHSKRSRAPKKRPHVRRHAR